MAEKLRRQLLSMEQQNEQLLEKVRNFPCLYDKTKKTDKDKNVCLNAWKAVCLDPQFLETLFFLGY